MKLGPFFMLLADAAASRDNTSDMRSEVDRLIFQSMSFHEPPGVSWMGHCGPMSIGSVAWERYLRSLNL